MKRMIGLALAVAIAFAACTYTPTPVGNEPTQSVPIEQKNQPQDSGSVLLLVLALPEESEPLADALRILARNYVDSGPGHGVGVMVRTGAESEQALLAELLGGAPPDLFLMRAEYARGFGNAGLLQELSGEVEEQALLPAARTHCGGETLWAVPYLGSAPALLANEGLLRKAGITALPESWSALRKTSRTVTAMTEAAGFAGVTYPSADLTDIFLQLYASFGGEYPAQESGEPPNANGEEMQQALNFYVNLLENGATEESAINDMSRAVQEFWLGRSALCIGTPAHLAMLEKNGFRAATGALPSERTHGGANLTAYAFAVPVGGNERAVQAACDFIRWLLEPEQLDFVLAAQYKELDAGVQRPPREALLLPLVWEGAPRFFTERPQYEAFVHEMAYAAPPADGKKWGQYCANALLPALRRVLSGDQNRDETMRALLQKGTEIWMN